MEEHDELLILCRNVRFLRRQMGLNQKALARLMGIGLCSLRKLEHGQMPPQLGIDAVIRLAFLAKLPPAELFQPQYPDTEI